MNPLTAGDAPLRQLYSFRLSESTPHLTKQTETSRLNGAAFDMIDHTVLLKRLNWSFGVVDLVLSI